jgi:hypothetical protein
MSNHCKILAFEGDDFLSRISKSYPKYRITLEVDGDIIEDNYSDENIKKAEQQAIRDWSLPLYNSEFVKIIKTVQILAFEGVNNPIWSRKRDSKYDFIIHYNLMYKGYMLHIEYLQGNNPMFWEITHPLHPDFINSGTEIKYEYKLQALKDELIKKIDKRMLNE